MDLVAERLTQEAFAPYAAVIAVPVRPVRKYYSSGLGNARASARRASRWCAGAGRRLAARGEAPRAARVFRADLRAALCWTLARCRLSAPDLGRPIRRPRPRLH